MIELNHVTAGYAGKAVLHDVSLTIRPGEVLALVGPNGSGKSTLLRTILGFQKTMEGSVFLNHRNIRDMWPREIAQQAAFLSQSRRAPSITARKMVLHARFPYLSYPRRYGQKDYEIADAALRRADALELGKRPMTELSGGQQQKVYLAMAMAQQTDVLLMDEPTAYLDIAHQFRTMALARELAGEGKAVVLVLHDLPLALENAHRLAVLQEGRLVQLGTPEELYATGVLDKVFDIRLERTLVKGKQHYFCQGQEV